VRGRGDVTGYQRRRDARCAIVIVMKGLVVLLLLASTAHAQQATGAVDGRVTDPVTHLPMEDATVTATSPQSLPQVVRTDGDGRFLITQLLPGYYTITVVAPDGRMIHQGRVRISPGTTAVGSFVLDRRYLTDLPVPGRTIDGVFAAGPRARWDGYGVAFAGSTSLENRYFIDGIDVTELGLGALGTTLPDAFIDQLRTIASGAGPELGRATGGFIEVATKHGTNEWHGSVFGSFTPSWLAATPKEVPHYPQTIDVSAEWAYSAELGFDLGGPIVKDRLWFYVGFAPQLARVDYTRRIESQTDCRLLEPDGSLSRCRPEYADGRPDLDPKTGFPIVDTVASEVREAPIQSYPAIARVDAAITPEHQASLTAIVLPSSLDQPGLIGLASTGTSTTQLASDIGAHWMSKLLDGALELDGRLAWHHSGTEVGAIDPDVATHPQRTVAVSSFADLAQYGGESPQAIAACTDRGPGDAFPRITNCPIGSYTIGGPGLISRDVQDRYSARVAATARVHGHAVTAGVEVNDERDAMAQVDSGGYVSIEFGEGTTFVQRFVDDRTCSRVMGGVSCRALTSLDDATRHYASLEGAAFVRDAWQPLPGLVFDVGVRYEAQHIRYPTELQNTVDPINGFYYGNDLLDLRHELAPRIGIAYDPTREGRANLYAHWGRYYGSIPLSVAETVTQHRISSLDYVCPPSQPACANPALLGSSLYPVDPTLVAHDLAPEYVDELVAGGLVEIARDWNVGATFVDRRLGNVIEDVATHGNPETIANPGPAYGYDTPARYYDAITLSVDRRFSTLYLRAAYTYSHTWGDYPGDVSYDNAQLMPHLSTQYDIAGLLANHRGALPQDRPHLFRVDAAAPGRLGRHGTVVLGASIVAMSGAPETALAGEAIYGPNESYLLPRSAFGRTPGTVQLDLHIAYRHSFASGRRAEVYTDIFNLFDTQSVSSVDNSYAAPIASAQPISGGNYSDLIWIKATSFGTGEETRDPLQRNTTFHQPTAYYPPLSARLGFRLTF
jgi:hypothetical protein